MTSYNGNEEFLNEEVDSDEGLNTMAVLSTLGGSAGDEAMAEGEPLGLDPDAGKAKLSGSTLAVGVVVVLGAVAVLGMKLTLGALASGSDPTDAMAEIEVFLAQQSAAQTVGVEGPIKAPDDESNRVLEELKQDMTEHQVPAEEVESNPFDISQIVRTAVKPPVGPGPKPPTDARGEAVKRAQADAAKLKVDGISGPIVFIDGKDYRVGETLDGGRFTLTSIDGLTCIIRTTDEHRIALRLRYR